MTFARFCLVLLVLTGSTSYGGDWVRFRGPNGTGISEDEAATPVTWSPEENLKWKTALPGAGVSSPIIVGDRVFVTCYSGYGVDRENPGDMDNLKRHLVCVDANSGDILWDKTVDAVLPEDPFAGIGVTAHGYASHTPVSDGERVYVFFGKTGALAFDLDGNQLWQTAVGTESDPRRWGSSSSPILYENLVIVTASAESQAIVGLDKETGAEVWRQEAAGLDNVWGTPALIESGEGKTELVIGVPNEIWGLNPSNGKLRWFAAAMETDQFNSSVVVSDDTAFAIEGRGGGSIAVKAGGKGDVTDSNVVWTGRDSGRFGSPIVYEGRIYFISNGVANCIEAQSGEKIYQERLSGGNAPGAGGRGGGRGGRGGFGGGFGGDYASPVVADGKLYFIKSSGETHVLKLGEQFEELAVNRLTTDSETFGGTPAISNGRLFIRSDKHLYCVGSP